MIFKDPLKNKVTCETCHCWLDRRDSQEVRVTVPFYNTKFRHYCGTCRKPYTRVLEYYGSALKRYFREIEVDEAGEPVGYSKTSNETNKVKQGK